MGTVIYDEGNEIPLLGESGQVSDGFHTFDELYDFRALYNAAFFNLVEDEGLYPVVKSKRHDNGEECFGGGWFVVVCELPTGQISNHYEIDTYWQYFKVPEVEKAPKWDGHTAMDVLDRLQRYLWRKS